jgi:hypothetical protein
MGGVIAWFEELGEIPLRPPFRVREYAPITDEPDRPVDRHFVDSICGVAFAIEHCDAHGWMSTRTIRCLSIDPRHPAAISAYCHASDRVMTFRVERIISIIDLHKAKVVSSEHHLALLAPYLSDGEPNADVEALIELQHTARDGVFALLQIAMRDGSLSEEARAVVADYVRAEATAAGVAFPPGDLVELWVGNLSPPLASVSAAITRLLEDRERTARLLPYLLKVARQRENSASMEKSLHELMAAVRRHFQARPRGFPRTLRATR